MPSVNVYIPDDLKERLADASLNLSAIAQEAWERELDIMDTKTGGISTAAFSEHGEEVVLRFDGSEVATSNENGGALYLTDEDVLVFVPAADDFWTMPRSEVESEQLEHFFARDADAYSRAASFLGLKRVIHL